MQVHVRVVFSSPVGAADLAAALGELGGLVPSIATAEQEWLFPPAEHIPAIALAIRCQGLDIAGAGGGRARPYTARAGIGVDTAAAERLVGAAAPGQVLVDGTVRDALKDEAAAAALAWERVDSRTWECVYADPPALLNRPFEAMFAAEMAGWVGPRRGLAAPPLAPAVGNGLFGIALSGGGQRSAIFSLGVCQALSRYGLLQRADYISSVSGGGYFSASLQAVCCEAVPYAEVPEGDGRRQMGADAPRFPFRFPRDPEAGDPAGLPVHGLESPAMFHVRKYANLLGNHIGLLDPATWATFNRWLGATLLSWLCFLVPIPMLAICGGILLWDAAAAGWFTDTVVRFEPRDEWWGPPFALDSTVRVFWARIFLPALVAIIAGGIIGFFASRSTTARTLLAFAALAAIGYMAYPALAGAVFLLEENDTRSDVFKWVGTAVSSLSAVATAVGLAGSMRGTSPGRQPLVLKALTLAGGYVLLLTIVVLLSWATWNLFDSGMWKWPGGWWWLVGLASASALPLVAFGIFVRDDRAGRMLNRLSIHSLYEERIGRTWIISPNRARPTSPWTMRLPWTRVFNRQGLRLGQLVPDGGAVPTTPYPLLCATINIPGSRGEKLPERKADSFVLAPLFGGSASTRWFPMDERAEAVYREMTVASAAATSGAAFTSNMGEKGNRTLSILFTVFNVRIGRWCTNPRRTNRESRSALALYLKELLSLPARDDHQVYLSDGGHFENLGLYELIRRRCKYIVAVTADTEGDSLVDAHGNLGKAARYIREDFGVQLHMHGLAALERDAQGGVKSWYCVGEVRYPREVDTGGVPAWESGVIVVIKTGMVAAEASVDLINHWRQNPAFPYDATIDQQYDQAQFEAYRQLGYLAGRAVAKESLPGEPDLEVRFRAIARAFARQTATPEVRW